MTQTKPSDERRGVYHSSVSPQGEDAKNLAPSLTELSERDRPWTTHRTESDAIAQHYAGTEFNRYTERISQCANFLDFKLAPDKSAGVYRLKLSSAYFCHVRTCQVCSWRKSLAAKARAYEALPKVIADHPKARFLFLTLTAKNCDIGELNAYIKWMNKGFGRLVKLKDFPAMGYLKTVEVTRGRDGKSAHPHFHVLIFAKSSYFGRDYIKQADWVQMWRDSLRVDYNPILDVQALKNNGSLVALIAEVIKYQTKPATLVHSEREWFLEYTRQMHHVRSISFGGVFKEYFKKMKKDVDDQEMIQGDSMPDDDTPDEGHLYFGWRYREKKYRMIDGVS
jgi:plasmid rolling circle replication initiator protein Rep